MYNFLNGGSERRTWKERKRRGERRKGRTETAEGSSLFVGALGPEGKELLIERRKENRFQVREGAFALFEAGTARLGQILDISMGGLGFRY